MTPTKWFSQSFLTTFAVTKIYAYQIHTIPRAGNKADVADGIKGTEFVER